MLDKPRSPAYTFCMDASQRNRANRLKRPPLSADVRRRLAAAIRRNRPWDRSTGPRTGSGKARCRLNAQRHGQRAVNSRVATNWLASLKSGSAIIAAVINGEIGDLTEAEVREAVAAMQSPPLDLDVAALTHWLAGRRGHAAQPDPQLLLFG